MLKASIKRPSAAAIRAFEQASLTRMERAASIAADKAAGDARTALRRDFVSVGARRLGFAVGSGSDRQKQRGVIKRGDGFTTSGWIFIRSKSERTRGAIEAFTEGGEIRPVKGKWLWIPTQAIPARVGKYRMTPARYLASGLVNSIGPLIFKEGRKSGEAVLVVRNVTTRIKGRPNARRLPRSGRARSGRQARDEVVAFVGIRRTSRAARVSVDARLRQAQAAVQSVFAEEMSK